MSAVDRPREARAASKRPPKPREAGDLRFGRRNYAALGAALAAIVLGFVLLSRGSITLAPILLVLGYCILIPYGLAAGQGGGGRRPEGTRGPTGE